MSNKVLVILASADREVLLECGIEYSLNAAKAKWMEEVKVIFFGPSEKLAVFDLQVIEKIQKLKDVSIEILACKWCSDRMNITKQLEESGIKVLYVGPIISQLIKDGWATLSF
jgi:hypothetical protein